MKIAIMSGMGLAHYSRDLATMIGEDIDLESVDIFSPELGKTKLIESQGFARQIVNLYECWTNPYEGDDYMEVISRWDNRLGPGVLNAALVADRYLFREYVATVYRPRIVVDRSPNAKETKHRILAALLRTLERYFEERKPDLYLTYATASLALVLLYRFCQHYGTQFIMLSEFRFQNYLSLADNPYLVCQEVQERYLSDTPFSEEALAEAGRHLDGLLARYRGNQREGIFGTVAKDRYEQKKSFSWFHILRRTLSRSWTKTRDYLKRRDGLHSFLPWDASIAYFRHLSGPRLDRSQRFESPIDGEPFVLFPLHVTPEASSSVFAPFYTNQLELIERLSKSIPLHWKLYVKEHLPMLGKRTPEFYRRVREYHNVRLIDSHIPTPDLIQGCELVFTISGTAAMESAMLGKPYIMLTQSTYDVLELGIHNSPIDRLPATIHEAVALGRNIDPAERRRRQERFLASGMEVCFPFPMDAIWNYDPARHEEHLPSIRKIAQEIVRITGA